MHCSNNGGCWDEVFDDNNPFKVSLLQFEIHACTCIIVLIILAISISFIWEFKSTLSNVSLLLAGGLKAQLVQDLCVPAKSS